MAIVCCLCGKKQSGWISDFPFSVELSEYRICAECFNSFDKLVNAEKLEDVPEEVEYIKNVAEKNINIDSVIKNRIKRILSKENESKSFQDVENEIVDERMNAINSVMVTSGFEFQGYTIVEYHDYVSSEVVMGMGVFKSLFAGISNFTGFESNALSEKIAETRKMVLNIIRKRAMEAGANAIIGLDMDFTMFGETMIAVIANGTAVTIEKCVNK
mgnify:FL=1